MFVERRPQVGEFVIYWTLGPDGPVPNQAFVCNVAKEGINPDRPHLNLTVFRAEDAKTWARVEVPPVYDDGSEPVLPHKYSLPGEYA